VAPALTETSSFWAWAPVSLRKGIKVVKRQVQCHLLDVACVSQPTPDSCGVAVSGHSESFFVLLRHREQKDKLRKNLKGGTVNMLEGTEQQRTPRTLEDSPPCTLGGLAEEHLKHRWAFGFNRSRPSESQGTVFAGTEC
jgi:hypothetical protein